MEAPPEGVAGLGVLGESAIGSGAVVAVEADESATEASSSLSVSTKSSGFLMGVQHQGIQKDHGRIPCRKTKSADSTIPCNLCQQ